MLVLSRKENQQILFPNLGISIKILRTAGKAVRVGVDAPDDIRVIRGELADKPIGDGQPAKSNRHELRNRLSSVGLALQLLQKQLNAGLEEQAAETLSRALSSLPELDRLVPPQQTGSPDVKTDSSDRQPVAPVVEDNADERELLAGYPNLSDHRAETVEDGLAAMSYLTNNEQPSEHPVLRHRHCLRP